MITQETVNSSPRSAAYASVNRVSIGLDNGLSPIRRQAIIYTNAGSLPIGPLGTNFSEISIKTLMFSFTKMHLYISSAKWRPFCPGGDELKQLTYVRWLLTLRPTTVRTTFEESGTRRVILAPYETRLGGGDEAAIDVGRVAHERLSRFFSSSGNRQIHGRRHGQDFAGSGRYSDISPADARFVNWKDFMAMHDVMTGKETGTLGTGPILPSFL